ncbi:MAG: tRNA (adenosine(37)-N6)-threonylcarbamoyltransferase complex transferase subunit TsaD [Bacteroidetes bacterium]|nr:MAG: tRNA (adenosine(37)-N6)-threonylcarbamoyltransferase complex transferase subunit TsaD [Bacteroidota bacterium]
MINLNMIKPIKILAIESSCDETAASVVVDGKILSNVISTQPIHSQYGGVIPEIASRNHEKNIIPVIEEALQKAQVSKKELSAIAFTQGPGLLGSLLVGTCFAKSFALSLGIPLIGVHHVEAHIMAHFIDEPVPSFPFLCLTVSGGHTLIVKVNDVGQYEIIGATLDDAVGEAFDKAAKLLGLPYPGGPILDKLAQSGNPDRFQFSMPEIRNYDFSFSGIKTSILYFLQNETTKNENFIAENLNDICASVQYTLVEILMRKLKKASKELKIKQIAIAGGVAANSELRKRLELEKQKSGWTAFIPQFQYCTDNAAMIAITAHYKYIKNQFVTQLVSPNARMEMA